MEEYICDMDYEDFSGEIKPLHRGHACFSFLFYPYELDRDILQDVQALIYYPVFGYLPGYNSFNSWRNYLWSADSEYRSMIPDRHTLRTKGIRIPFDWPFVKVLQTLRFVRTLGEQADTYRFFCGASEEDDPNLFMAKFLVGQFVNSDFRAGPYVRGNVNLEGNHKLTGSISPQSIKSMRRLFSTSEGVPWGDIDEDDIPNVVHMYDIENGLESNHSRDGREWFYNFMDFVEHRDSDGWCHTVEGPNLKNLSKATDWVNEKARELLKVSV